MSSSAKKEWESALQQGDTLSADGDDAGALTFYDTAVNDLLKHCGMNTAAAASTDPRPFLRRALCHERLIDPSAALADLFVISTRAKNDGSNNHDKNDCKLGEYAAEVCLAEARCLLETGDIARAEEAFARAKEAGADKGACDRGTRKCAAHRAGGAAIKPQAANDDDDDVDGSNKNKKGEKDAGDAAAGDKPAGPVKPRFSWYQSEGNVTIDVFVRGTKEDEVTVEADESIVKFSHATAGELKLKMFAAVDAASLTWRCAKPKVEIKINKRGAGMWSDLERPDGAAGFMAAHGSITHPADEGEFRPSYPSSSTKPKNWDAIDHDIAEEEKKEVPQGEDALNKLLQQIYANADDETKRSMNRSYQLSHGTVLSTNKEVLTQDIKPRAPKGMVIKKWGTDEVVATDEEEGDQK